MYTRIHTYVYIYIYIYTYVEVVGCLLKVWVPAGRHSGKGRASHPEVSAGVCCSV